MAQQALAACDGTFRTSGAPLSFDEQKTPRRAQPYSLNTWADPFLPQQLECGTWSVRVFVLYTKRNSRGGSVDRPLGRAVLDPSTGQLRAGYSTSGGDLLVLPVLLLAQPSRNVEDLADPRVWDLATSERQRFQNLKFALKDPALKDRWTFQPVSGVLDDGRPQDSSDSGSNSMVNFVVSCGEAACTAGELAEAAALAAGAELAFRRRIGDLAAALE
jgi:hypothetical protein